MMAGLVVALGGCAPEGGNYVAFPTTLGESTIPPVAAPLVGTVAGGTHYIEISIPRCTPQRLIANSIGLDANIYTMSDRDIRDGAVDPQYFDAVAWDSEVGSAPGTDSDNTTYLYGHSSYKAGVVFNKLKDLKSGDEVTIDTCSGRLHFTVDKLVPVDKSALAQSNDYQTVRPGWVVLVTCYRPNGDEPITTQNVFVILRPLFTVNTASAG